MTSLSSLADWLRRGGLLTQTWPTSSFSAVVFLKPELGELVIPSLVGIRELRAVLFSTK